MNPEILSIFTNGYPDGRKYCPALQDEILTFQSVMGKTRSPEVYKLAKDCALRLEQELNLVRS